MHALRVRFDEATASCRYPRRRRRPGAGRDDHAADPKMQIGANPVSRPVRVSDATDVGRKVVGWGQDTRTVVRVQVHALATGFEHPRSLRPPNGDAGG